MGRVKSAAEALRLGCERSSRKYSNIVNDEINFKKLQPAVERKYQKMMDLWIEYRSQTPEASPYDIVSLKDFIRKMAYGIDGAEGIDVACSETVRKLWNSFTASFERAYPKEPIPKPMARAVTEFINGPLREEMGMPKTKRARRFASKTVLLNYARQLFAEDWIEHKHPGTMIDDWGLQLGNVYSSSRIGEYIESTCRAGTGRGLCFKDLIFIVFINEIGRPEFAIQLTRDAKNMTSTPNKRPQHALYEGNEDSKPGVLCFNPMFPFLARLVAYEAFRDYRTIDELLNIVPKEDDIAVLEWREELLETPFFKSQSKNSIETASAFSHRQRLLGLRAGYSVPPRHHDIRAEGLYLMSLVESEASRMVYAGHTDPNILPRHYMPRNGADGQAAYHGQKRRALVLDVFRGLTIPRNPSLLQCLPAKEQYEFENEPELIRLNQELLMRRGTTDPAWLLERKRIYAEKRKLLDRKLKDWQRRQPTKHGDPAGYHRAIFDRVRFMMPERDRLARNLFEIDVLRSPIGIKVLQDMIALYRKSANVEYRPGLEPDKCRCGRSGQDNFSDYEGDKNSSSYNWRHIYNCYKAALEKVYGFAELCFLCNEWVCGDDGWEAHCQQHMDLPESIPIWCDPLTYGGVLARAGYCPFCLENKGQPASVRMYQFKTRRNWLDHIQGHIGKLQDECMPVRCPRQHPHCPGVFDSVLELQFHLQDAFGVERLSEFTKMKRSIYECDDFELLERKRQRRHGHGLNQDNEIACTKMQHVFTNITTDRMELDFQIPPASSRLSRHATSSPSSTTYNDSEAASYYGTSPSSVASEELIDPDLSSAETKLDSKPTDLIATDKPPKTPHSLVDIDENALQVEHEDEISTRSCTGGLISGRGDEETESDHIIRNEDTTSGVLLVDDIVQPDSERPLTLDQDGIDFDVEELVAKGRIGRRIWYKVKWKDYPESDNSWVRKKDVGSESIADYEAGHPRNQGQFEFERLVSKKEIGGDILYEAKWHGQAAAENIWVGRGDLAAKVVSAFEAELGG